VGWRKKSRRALFICAGSQGSPAKYLQDTDEKWLLKGGFSERTSLVQLNAKKRMSEKKDDLRKGKRKHRQNIILFEPSEGRHGAALEGVDKRNVRNTGHAKPLSYLRRKG